MQKLMGSLLASGLLAIACGGSSSEVPAGARPVAVIAGITYGASCQTDVDCGGQSDSCCTGGKCSATGWCSPKCASDKDCPTGFFCIDWSGARCFAACSDDRSCPDGFICEEKNGHRTCRAK